MRDGEIEQRGITGGGRPPGAIIVIIARGRKGLQVWVDGSDRPLGIHGAGAGCKGDQCRMNCPVLIANAHDPAGNTTVENDRERVLAPVVFLPDGGAAVGFHVSIGHAPGDLEPLVVEIHLVVGCGRFAGSDPGTRCGHVGSGSGKLLSIGLCLDITDFEPVTPLPGIGNIGGTAHGPWAVPYRLVEIFLCRKCHALGRITGNIPLDGCIGSA